MQRTLILKTIIVIALTLLIAVPLMMIQATIGERIRFHDEAVRSIAADSVSEQTVVGPVLVLPYSDSYEEEEIDADSKKKVVRQYSLLKRHLVYPNSLVIDGSVDTDQRYRGMHKVLIYSGRHAISGDFAIPALDAIPKTKANSRLLVGQPFVAMGISDTRGLRDVPAINWGGKSYEFQQGSKLNGFQSGINAPLDVIDLSQPSSVKFSFHLGLDGIERLSFVPIAKNNQVTLRSKWPHAQFAGRFLPSPKDRVISANGFTATWNISALSSDAQQEMSKLERGESARTDAAPAAAAAAASAATIDHFSVAFIEPVNIYTQADRAVKYGLMFVALTFAAFFLFELLKQLPIHPVQYTLVGLALALFFLLLVSLSEHISFLSAYLVASACCIVLIGFYLAFALRNWLRGLGFGVALTLLYGVLFGLLQSENNALVMGSILMFAVLAAIMVITRKVDWYALGGATTPTRVE